MMRFWRFARMNCPFGVRLAATRATQRPRKTENKMANADNASPPVEEPFRFPVPSAVRAHTFSRALVGSQKKEAPSTFKQYTAVSHTQTNWKGKKEFNARTSFYKQEKTDKTEVPHPETSSTHGDSHNPPISNSTTKTQLRVVRL